MAAASGGAPGIPSPHDAPLAIQPGWRTITEGAAVVWYPGPDAVFYNKVQIFNRDLTMAVTRVYDAQRRASATPKDVHKVSLRRDLRRDLAKQAAAGTLAPAAPDGLVALAPAPPAAILATLVPNPTAARHAPFASTAAAGEGAGEPAAVAPSDALPGLRILEALSASGLRSIR